jgi:hypothetical protein
MSSQIVSCELLAVCTGDEDGPEILGLLLRKDLDPQASQALFLPGDPMGLVSLPLFFWFFGDRKVRSFRRIEIVPDSMWVPTISPQTESIAFLSGIGVAANLPPAGK